MSFWWLFEAYVKWLESRGDFSQTETDLQKLNTILFNSMSFYWKYQLSMYTIIIVQS
jgi:hypothetical protein